MSAQNTVGKPRLTTSAMIASIASEGQRVRAAPFGKALVELAATRPDIVGMTADLSKYTDLHLFAQAYPERFFQMGMAEQLLMGAAGGMAKEGFTPFATTYAVFASRRAYDFIHQVIAEEHLNVKIACALPGLTSGYGPSHQATEDLAMMRGIPGLTIIDPCDALDVEQMVPAAAAHQGPVYMRLLRGQVPLVLDEYDYAFELGRAKLLRDGNDVLIISSGIMTMRALEVAKEMAGGAADVAVLHVPTCESPHARVAWWSWRKTIPVLADWARPWRACWFATGSAPRFARSRCPTSSCTRAHCPRCMIATGFQRRR